MKDTLQFKNFEIIEKKEESDGRLRISGWAAYYNNVDSYGDIIIRGAFAKTLVERKGRIAFCLQHDIWNPVAKIELLEERENGLWCEALISAAEEDVQTKVKEGILSEMSIGYKTMKSRQGGGMGYEDATVLEEIKLIEISLVTVAANPLARVEEMKSEQEKNEYIQKEFDRVLAIVKNEQINFEIQKLKSLVFGLTPAVEQQPEDEAQLSKDDILTALIGQKNEFINALKNN